MEHAGSDQRALIENIEPFAGIRRHIPQIMALERSGFDPERAEVRRGARSRRQAPHVITLACRDLRDGLQGCRFPDAGRSAHNGVLIRFRHCPICHPELGIVERDLPADPLPPVL